MHALIGPNIVIDFWKTKSDDNSDELGTDSGSLRHVCMRVLFDVRIPRDRIIHTVWLPMNRSSEVD